MRQFYYGILALSGIQMMHQDHLGLEAYLEWVKEHWVVLPPWVGLCLFFFALLAALRVRDENRLNQKR